MNYGVLAYKHTFNLGDAIQSIALSRILPNANFSVFRQYQEEYKNDNERNLVVNGYMREELSADSSVLYSGIYLENGAFSRFEKNLRDNLNIIGCRDPYTHKILTKNNVPSEFIGCATSTFDRYEGARDFDYVIDVHREEDTVYKTQTLDFHITWQNQWSKAVEVLARLRTANSVKTNRLHIAIPCLAFGTPVKIDHYASVNVSERARLSVLMEYGFEYDKFVELDMNPWADHFKNFLYSKLGLDAILPFDKSCPKPV